MDLQSAMLGGVIATAVISIILAVKWAIKHTQLVSKLKEDISSIEETVENAHKYLDSRITSTKDDATAQVQSVYDHIDDVKKDIHDKIDGVVADASKMVTASIDKVEGKN